MHVQKKKPSWGSWNEASLPLKIVTSLWTHALWTWLMWILKAKLILGTFSILKAVMWLGIRTAGDLDLIPGLETISEACVSQSCREVMKNRWNIPLMQEGFSYSLRRSKWGFSMNNRATYIGKNRQKQGWLEWEGQSDTVQPEEEWRTVAAGRRASWSLCSERADDGEVSKHCLRTRKPSLPPG